MFFKKLYLYFLCSFALIRGLKYISLENIKLTSPDINTDKIHKK